MTASNAVPDAPPARRAPAAAREINPERLSFLARVARREAEHLSGTDTRLFVHPLTVADIERQDREPELAERVDAFVARFGRLQDTLAVGLLPMLLQLSLEPVGTVIDNLNRAERLGWIRSVSGWARSRVQRNRMVHEYVEDMQLLADSLNAAHAGVADLLAAATVMAAMAEALG